MEGTRVVDGVVGESQEGGSCTSSTMGWKNKIKKTIIIFCINSPLCVLGFLLSDLGLGASVNGSLPRYYQNVRWHEVGGWGQCSKHWQCFLISLQVVVTSNNADQL